jgi:hypothetical protein
MAIVFVRRKSSSRSNAVVAYAVPLTRECELTAPDASWLIAFVPFQSMMNKRTREQENKRTREQENKLLLARLLFDSLFLKYCLGSASDS